MRISFKKGMFVARGRVGMHPHATSRIEARQLNTFCFSSFFAPCLSPSQMLTMTIMNLLTLGLPALVLGSSSLFGSMPLSDPMSDVCVVLTVVEQELHISTCFLSSTVATIDGYTTSVAGPTCIDTTVTESKTINAPTEAPNTAAMDVTVYETFTTDVYTTVCPSPTTFIYQDKTYTVTEPGGTTVTITGKLQTT
jgi:hypothetical protein